MSPPAAGPVLKVEGLRKSFGALEVLKGIDFELERGRTAAVIGPSGSGKSTLLRCLNHLEIPSSGHVYLESELVGEKLVDGRYVRMSEKQLARQRAEIGMIFQSFYLWPHLTAEDNVAIGPRTVGGLTSEEAATRARTLLRKVRLEEKGSEYPERLSGGQQQRVAIARALAQEPKLILFDEPTSALDPELVGEVLRVIRDLAEEGRSMVLVTHELAFAREVADIVLFMDQGEVLERGPPAQLLSAPDHPRTRAFLDQMLHP